ncbi:MAG: DUF2523 family protein [Pseudomonas sp.]
MDFGFIADFFTGINDFVSYVWDFMQSGIYQFFKDLLVTITKALIWSYLQATIFFLDVAYTVVQEILEDVGVTQQVQSMYGQIPADVRSTLAFFNVPQALTMIFSAFPTRWALKFVPFSGS